MDLNHLGNLKQRWSLSTASDQLNQLRGSLGVGVLSPRHDLTCIWDFEPITCTLIFMSNPSPGHMYVFSPDFAPQQQTHISTCLLTILSWISDISKLTCLKNNLDFYLPNMHSLISVVATPFLQWFGPNSLPFHVSLVGPVSFSSELFPKHAHN